MNKIMWELPLKTVSESNRSEHWTVSSKRHKHQQFFIRCLFNQKEGKTSFPFNQEERKTFFPCVIKMTRLSSRFLDSEENLPMAFKWIKDEIGACLFPEKVVNYEVKKKVISEGKVKFKLIRVKNKGHADSSPLVTWQYAQEKSKTMGVRIEIFSSTETQLNDIDHECS